MNKYKLTFGSDPEFFARNENYCYPPALFRLIYGVNAIDIIRKKSGFPHYIYRKEDEIVLMDDGAAFEITVPPVDLNNPEELYEYIQKGYSFGKELLDKFGIEFFPRPTINFDLTIFPEELHDKLFNATIFGCDEDYDADDNDFKAEKFDVSNYPYRHAGGHFVIGTKDNDLLEIFHNWIKPITKLLSMTVGSLALINSPFPEEEKQRQTYYGKPRRYRYPEYGIEYRSPSVSWTMKKSLYELMFQSAEKAIDLFIHAELGKKLLLEFEDSFRKAYKDVDIQTLTEIYNHAMEM